MGKLNYITISLIVFLGSLTVSAQSVSVADSLALVDLYNATNGANWTTKTNWLQPNSEARNWWGIFTNPDGTIWKIDLSSNNVTGTIPSSFGNITDLENLDLSDNNLSGSIPTSIGQLTNLTELRLDENQLSGSLPTEVGQLTSLISMRVDKNQLTGNIPSSLGSLSNLETLILSTNQFSGSIPSQLGQLINLRVLQISNTNVSGSIPTTLGQLTSLVTLALINNQLTGTIPSELGSLSNLTTLGLDQNELTGSFPTALLQLSTLATLTLSGNQLSGNLPSNFDALSNLRILVLSDNQFTGSIPSSLANITLLGSVRLSNNNFTGTIPSGLDQLTNSAFMIFEVDGNGLRFSDLETSHSNYVSGLGTYVYSPQAKVDQEETPSLLEGSTITLTSTDLTSANNSYQWYKDGVAITGATSKDYVIANATSADAGVYYFEATNSVVTGLTLTRNNITLTVEADTCGVSAAEKQALIDLYNSTDGDNWSFSPTFLWDLSGSVCDWFGVTVLDGKVTGLSLTNRNLNGPLPTSIGNLIYLESLWLDNNQISGTIPSEVGNLTNLTFFKLSNNNLTGSIPASIGNLSSLTNLDFRQNLLTGSIPPEIGSLSSLTNLNLDSNQLTGSIPTELGNLNNLNGIGLNINQLSGNIDVLASLSSLTSIFIYDNQFTGSIPTEFTTFPLSSLYIYNNQFSGQFPDFSASSINNLRFDNNNFVFADFENQQSYYTGNLNIYTYNPQAKVDQEEIPSVLEGGSITLTSTDLTSANNSYQWYKDGVAITGATSKDYVITNATSADAGVYYFEATNSVVTGLTLTRNNITFSVTPDTCGVSAAEKQALLDLYNSTDGDNWTNTLANNQPWDPNIPVCDWFGVTVVNGQVTTLQLTSNNLVGTIPASIGDLTSLTNLTLYLNQLSGSIPSTIGNLTNLKSLYLFGNNLTGTIPTEIGNLVSLENFYINSNQISGPIPTTIGNLTNLLSFRGHNNLLSGQIPAEIGNLTNITFLQLSQNQLSGNIPSEIGNLVNLTFLDLQINSIGGTVPIGIGNLTQLVSLFLGNNNLTGPLPQELGNLTSLSTLSIGTNQLSGSVPTELTNLTSLTNLDIRKNQLSGTIPNFTGVPLTQLRFNDNIFVFSDFENHHPTYSTNIGTYAYSPQAKVDQEETLTVFDGNSITLTSTDLTSTNNSYQWYKDGQPIAGATSKDYVITNATSADAGVYYFEATNSVVTGLTLTRNNITLNVTADTCGVSATEKQALLDLYNSTDGDNWTNTLANNQPWDPNIPVCDWYGVTVVGGNVTGLNLLNNGLNGTLTTSISSLTGLTTLNLSINSLAGPIPSEIGSMTNLLSLKLFSNDLTGTIPSSFANLVNLRTFNLGNNELTGTIPTWLGNLTEITDLRLYLNNLDGTIPIELGNLTKLVYLQLQSSNLSGVIPSELGNIPTLRDLELGSNQLTGQIPTSLTNLTNLDYLNVQGNQLEGTIPDFTGIDFSNSIQIHSNKFHFEDFENEHNYYLANVPTYSFSPQAKVDLEETPSVLEGGSITLTSTDLTSTNNSYQWYKDGVAITGATNKDYVITNATSADAGVYYFEATNSVVTGLTLTRNNITLSVTVDTCGVSATEKQALLDLYNSTDGDNWTNTLANNQPWDPNIPVCDWYGVTVVNGNVTSVDLDRNSLTGTIPNSIGDLTNVTYLELAHNQISGTLPSSIGSMSSLTTLFLEVNQISGSIPSSIGNLSNLTQLKIGYNLLSGSIPIEIGNLTYLSRLNLNDNNLSGSLPVEIGNLSNLVHLYLIDNEISGTIPPELGNLTKLRYFWLSNNLFTGEIPVELGNLTSAIDFHLDGNLLSGVIPAQLGNLINLDRIRLNGNQLTGPIPSEFGNFSVIRSIFLNNNQLSGNIPIEIAQIPTLQTISINENQLTGDMPSQFATLATLTSLSFISNNFVFSNFEAEHTTYGANLTSYNYSPQAKVDQEETFSILEYSSITLTSEALTSTNNSYQWYKDGVAITGATSKDYVITNATSADAGVYYFEATNSVVTGLTLTRNNITLSVEPGSNTVVQQNFCTADGVPTVADLSIPTPSGVSPIWYATETGGTPLDPSTVLQDRNTYWRDYSGNTNGRAAVKAIIDALLPIGNSVQSFDSTTNPTLNDLVVALNPLSSASQIQWYATATSTDTLPGATLLVDGQYYYAAESVTACRLKIKVNVAPQEVCVEVVSEGTGGQSVVDGSFEGAANVLIPNNRNEAMGANGWGAVLGTPDTFGTPYSNPNDPYLQATFTASPNGGICAGALRYQDQAETFVANIDGLETNATYIVEFYTANITNVVDEAVSNQVLGHWEVTFGGTTKLSGAIPPNTTEATTWKRQRLEFTNIGGSLQLLQFKVGSSATDQNSAYPVYMLIDGIRVYVKPQNVHTTVCATVDTQVFCDSDDDNPLTIADLTSPTGESVTWYSAALGGRQYFSTYELSNISSDFIWADDGSGNPRIPVEILLDFGAPAGDNYQSFDIANNPTLADLVVEGTNITWHSSYTSTSVLPLSTPLVSDTVYYAAQDGNDCRSSVEVFVGIPMLTGEGNQVFCNSSGPTISDLVMETTSPSYTLLWYNAETGGVAYNSTDSLVDGQTYYATQTSGTGESEERYPVKVSVIDTAEENILYERDIEVASGTTLANLTTFFELDPNILWYDFAHNGTAYSSSYTVNNGETYYARISEGLCDALEVLAVTVSIEDVVNPELVTCIKFIPQPGDRYVISGWVREHSATAVPTSTLEFTEKQTFITLLDHLTSKMLNKEQIPPVYELQSDPQAPKVNALLPFIKNFTGTNVTVYNFQLETEQIGAQQVAVGYSFALAPDNLYRFVYRTPMVAYELDNIFGGSVILSLDYHYPILNYDNLEIEYTDVAVVGNKFRITSNFILSGTTDSPYKSEFNGHTSDSDTDSGIEDNVQLFDYVEDPTYMVMDYLNTSIALYYEDVNGQEIVLGGSSVVFEPKGAIIDGWQRISGDFTIPSDAAYMKIILKNEGTGLNAYFDDVRMHPFDSNLKSFVYDPITQRLQAELDENNYATFYEYDTEGGLVRVKKETVRGVYTIQETRSGNSKLNNGSE